MPSRKMPIVLATLTSVDEMSVILRIIMQVSMNGTNFNRLHRRGLSSAGSGDLEHEHETMNLRRYCVRFCMGYTHILMSVCPYQKLFMDILARNYLDDEKLFCLVRKDITSLQKRFEWQFKSSAVK